MKPLRAAVVIPTLAGFGLLAVGRTFTGCVAIAMGVLQVQAPVVAPVASARAAGTLGRWGHAAAQGLAFAIWFPLGLVFALVGLGARLLRIDALGRRQVRNWSVPGAEGSNGSPMRPWAVHHRPAPTRRARAARWGLALVLAGALVVEVAELGPWNRSAGVSSSYTLGGVTVRGVPPAEAPFAVLGDEPVLRARQEQGELFQQIESDPATGWRLPATFDGTETRVANHRRWSVQTADHGPVVWFFGGSTMFGSDQRDGHTIPSEFARQAAADGQAVQVVNFGVHAFTAYQEAQQLQAAVKTQGAPDLVIFYDGYNDTKTVLGRSFLDSLDGEPPRAPSVASDTTTSTTAPRQQQAPRWLSPEQRYEAVIAIQARAAALADHALAGTDTPVLRFWQPNVFTRDPTSEELLQLRYMGYDDLARRTFATIFAGIRERLPEGFIDLSDVLDDAPTVYTDDVHTSEVGAKLVAEAMYAEARPALRAAT